MTVNELRQISTVLKQTDIKCLTAEEVESLIKAVEIDEYVQQIKDFKKHLSSMLPKAAASDDELGSFYDLDWTISFGNKSVTINNCASAYDAITDFIDWHIQHEL